MRGAFASLTCVLLLACQADPKTTIVTTNGMAPTFSHPVAFYDKTGTWNVMIADDPKLCSNLQFVQGPDGPLDLIDDGGSSLPSLRFELGTGKFMGNDLRSVGDDLVAYADFGGPLGLEDDTETCQQPAPAEPGDGGPFFASPCRVVAFASSGHAHLYRVDDLTSQNAQAIGDFDIQLTDGGELQGSFVATPCAQLDGQGGCTSVDGFSLFPLMALVGTLVTRRRRGKA